MELCFYDARCHSEERSHNCLDPYTSEPVNGPYKLVLERMHPDIGRIVYH